MRLALPRSIISWSLAGLLALSSGAYAQVAEESAVKAAFVYNFIVFTEWPANVLKEGQPIELCVNTYSPMASSLNVINGRPIKKSRLRLRQLSSLATLPASCRIVYLDSLDRHAWPQIKRSLGNSGVLTISDDSEISANGVTISLANNSELIVFDIDLNAARTSGLTMSSKLLKLARTLR